MRAEEDIIIVELGSRFVKAGFAGDASPKAVIPLGPEQRRRVGDHRLWIDGYREDWLAREHDSDWSRDFELWEHDLRDLDLGLAEDKLERVLREALTR